MRFLYAIIGAVALAPTLLFAQTQSASIITRTGNITPPLKYHFDLASSLTEGVNQGVRVAVSASNPEKTAIRFDSVRLFSKDGSPLGNNVASKTDALTPNPYSFIFQNFGIAPKDLVNVGGVQITFMDMGGENPTGKILVHGITVSVIRDTGESCIEIDPITITTPEKPRVTINQIQAARPLVQPGTHGDGGSGGSGGGGGSTSLGPYYPSNAANNGGGAIMWSNPSNVFADDEANAIASTGTNGQTANLDATGFGFGSIPTSATIDGIVLEIKRGVSPGATAQDTLIQLLSGGSAIGNNAATGSAWPTGYGVATYGGVTDANTFWGSSANAPIVTGATFGVRVSALIGMPTQAHIDYIRMTVYYTPVGGSVYDSFMDLLRSISRKITCRVAPGASCGK